MSTVRPATDKEKGHTMADQLSRFVNCFANDDAEKEAVERMVSDHRSLQQNMMRFFMKYVKAQAGQAECGCYDLRNEGTVKLCKEIMEIEHHLPLV